MIFTNFIEGSDDPPMPSDSQNLIVVAGAIGHPRD